MLNVVVCVGRKLLSVAWWLQLLKAMEEVEFLNKTQKFRVKFSFKGSWIGLDRSSSERNMYTIRNELSQCIYHNILEIALIPDSISYAIDNGEIKEALVQQIKGNQKYCQCQKGPRNYFTREKFVPSIKRLPESDKSIKCHIKFRDGCLCVDTDIYFNVVHDLRV